MKSATQASKPKHLAANFAAGLTLASIESHAALYDRGNGMIYDSTLNITWLQDANRAHTTGGATAMSW